jgi:hypothetical protein
MAYLNPIGSIGKNVDMFGDEIEYYPTFWTSHHTIRFSLIDIFDEFIHKIISYFGQKLYNNTDKKDGSFWVDVTINPKTREIVLTPKYYIYKHINDNHRFGWEELRYSQPLFEFMKDLSINELIIDYNGMQNEFDGYKITYNNKEHNIKTFQQEIYFMISEVLETDGWNEGVGGFGTMKLYSDNNGYLYHNWVEQVTEIGEPLILKEEDFE